MNARKLSLLAALSLPLTFAGANAFAHGSNMEPFDRNYFCRFMDSGGVEQPASAGCRAAKAAAGTSEVYQWNSSIVSNANRRSLDAVPDGQLCNAGDPSFRGFNLAPSVANYTATPISGGPLPFRYRATAPHRTATFKVYLSKPSYDGSRALGKADIDLIATVTDAVLAGDTFQFTVPMPQRAAGSKAVALIEWNRVAAESGEGYYTCADLIYR